MVDDSINDWVRALAAINSNQPANDITVGKVGSSAVEYFRALVEARKESSKKTSETEFVKNEVSQPDIVETVPDGGGGGDASSWPMMPSDEFLSLLKNAQTFASSNSSKSELKTLWNPGESSVSNLTSFFPILNGSFSEEEDFFAANGTFQLNRDLTSGE